MKAAARRQQRHGRESSVAEVATLWSGTILDVAQLGHDRGERRRFTIGEAPTCDCWVEPAAIVGRSALTIAAVEGDRTIVTVPTSAKMTLETTGETLTGAEAIVERGLSHPAGDGLMSVTMADGWVAQAELGDVIFRVRRTEAGRLDGAPAPIEWSAVNWTGASVLVHSLFLALLLAIPPVESGISLDGADAHDRFVSYLVAPPEIEPPPPIDFGLEEPTETREPVQRGSAHEGEGGMTGHREAPDRNTHSAIRARGGDEVRLSRDELRHYAASSGILSALGADVPASPFGSTTPNGVDVEDALGHLMGIGAGDSFGYGGLAIAGTGRGGNGRDGSIRIGLDLTTIGRVGSRSTSYGNDPALVEHRSRRSGGPAVRVGTATVSGSLSREVIRREIRLHRNEISHCYQIELNRRPDLAGRVTVRFVIDQRGIVVGSTAASSTMESPAVDQCVARVIGRITFPAPENGVVVVTYPFTFVPQD